MKCARAASGSSAERRGRPSGAPAACVGGRAAGGGARRPPRPPPHDECRHPLPPPSAPFAACRHLCMTSSLPQFCLPRDAPPATSYLSRDPPSAALCLPHGIPCRNFLPALRRLSLSPRLSQSKRMAIYQRNARSGETAGTKNREMHYFQSQLEASAFANLLRPGETPLAVFK